MDVIEGAKAVADEKFTRREYLLYETVMDGHCTIDEAIGVVTAYAAEHPDDDLSETFTWAEWDSAKAEG
jgi:hypothetical protein